MKCKLGIGCGCADNRIARRTITDADKFRLTRTEVQLETVLRGSRFECSEQSLSIVNRVRVEENVVSEGGVGQAFGDASWIRPRAGTTGDGG